MIVYFLQHQPGKVTMLSWWRVDLLVSQGQLLLEVEAHGLVLLLAVPERADQLGVDLIYSNVSIS